MDDDQEHGEDYYEAEDVEDLREEDEIDDSEEAFMRGYDEDVEESNKGKDEYA